MSEDTTKQNYPFETGSLSANTWTKIIKTIPGHANLTFNNDTGQGLSLSIRAFTGADWTDAGVALNTWAAWASGTRVPVATSTWFDTDDATFAVTGVQLEAGSVATEFEHRTYADELWRCRRYCQASTADDNDFLFGPGYEGGGGSFYLPLMLNPPMRGSPSMSVISGNWKQNGPAGSSAEYTGAMTAYDQQPGPIHTALLFWKDTDFPSSNDGETCWMRAGEDSTIIALNAEL